MTQTSILDFQPSIDTSYNAAKHDWKEEAEATIDILIKIGDDFTSEKVIEILDSKGVTTKDNRALGGLFQRYSKQGYIRFIRYTKATRASRHNAPIALWRPVTRLANV